MPGPLEGLAGALDLGADHAALHMVVDQAHGLDEGVGRGRTDEAPAAFLQVLREGDGGFRGGLALRRRQRLGVGLETPEVGRQGAFFLDQLAGALGVVDRSFDLAAMPDDALVLVQTRSMCQTTMRLFRKCASF